MKGSFVVCSLQIGLEDTLESLNCEKHLDRGFACTKQVKMACCKVENDKIAAINAWV